jgi:luciferase family oxidoreductase group 1
MVIALSALEVAPAEKNRSAGEALAAVGVLAQRLDELGFTRLWFAEHHASTWATSVVPAVLTAHYAARTARIRLGSGGVLAPNHAPRALAEQFATLGVLYPGRIDIGIGRGPGTHDQDVARALRRGAELTTDAEYQADVREILRLLSGVDGDRLISGEVGPVDAQPWLLSSSTAGAELAGELGLPIAFAHHLRPDHTMAAISHYRKHFRPSPWAERPYVMVCVEMIVAETDEEAQRLGASVDLAKVGLFSGRGEAPLLPPEEAAGVEIPEDMRLLIEGHGATQARGSVDTVARRFTEITGVTGADELMLMCAVYDPELRVRSFELAAKAAALT